MSCSRSATDFTQRGTRPPRTANSSEPTSPQVQVFGTIARVASITRAAS